jgi:hypothetical protein
MKALKILVLFALVYVGIVVVFESLLGYLQPANESTVVITTTDEDGHPSDRVVSRLDSEGQIYVAANHWPRAWYRQALRNPDVQVAIDGERREYRAVPVSPAEHERLMAEHGHSFVFRILTGFPPRYFLRLDPRASDRPGAAGSTRSNPAELQQPDPGTSGFPANRLTAVRRFGSAPG